MSAAPQYAKTTTVSTDRTIAEIKALVAKYGANKFGTLEQDDKFAIAFEYGHLQVRFTVELPDRNDRQFTHTATRQARHPDTARTHWEQACRSRYRALLLVIKAKLEGVAAGVTSFEKEFYAFVVLPSGATVYEATAEQVDWAIATNNTGRLSLEGPDAIQP
jgi:hypothetical protein